jgi:hypothetical protein
MRSLFLSVVLGISALVATAATPSRAEARPWRGGFVGWRGGWGGWHGGWYRPWWGGRYWYPRWGWGWGTYYYPYAPYYYPNYYSYPGYGAYYPTYSAYDGQGTPSLTTGEPQQGAEKVTALDLLGVPTQDGRLSWPLALRILPPDEETRALRNQIDALVQEAATQASKDQVKPSIREEAIRAIGQLHELLRKKKNAITASYTYDEADRFLDQLAKGLKRLP